MTNDPDDESLPSVRVIIEADHVSPEHATIIGEAMVSLAQKLRETGFIGGAIRESEDDLECDDYLATAD